MRSPFSGPLVPGGAHAIGRLVGERHVHEPVQHRLHRSRDPRPDRLLDVLDHLERQRSGRRPRLLVLAQVPFVHGWSSLPSSVATVGREPPPHVLPVDFHNFRDATVPSALMDQTSWKLSKTIRPESELRSICDLVSPWELGEGTTREPDGTTGEPDAPPPAAPEQ